MITTWRFAAAGVAFLGLVACSSPARQGAEPPADQASAHLGDVDRKQDEGCAPGKERWREQGAPKRGGVMVMPGLPLNLDYPAPGRNAMHQVYETLLKPRSCFAEDTVLVPGLAKSWTVSPDGQTFTLSLRDDVKWHNKPPVNGRAFTSADVAWTIENHRRGGFFEALWKRVDYTTPDPNTVVLRLRQPDADFIDYLGWYHQNSIMPREIKEQHGDFKTVAVGTGVFMLKNFTSGQDIELERTPNYYLKGADGQNLPYLDGYKGIGFADNVARLAAFRSGQIDGTEGFGFPTVEADAISQAMPKVKRQKLVLVASIGAIINHTIKPFDNVKIRQALAYALDGDQMIEGAERGAGLRTGFIHPNLKEYAWPQEQIRQKFRYDPELAKKLLAEAGYGPGNALEFELSIPNFVLNSGEIAQRMWDQVGIKTRVRTLPGGHPYLGRGDFVVMWNSTNNNVSPGYWASDLVHSTGSVNYGKFSHPRVDQLADAQAKEVDPAKRRAILTELQDLLFETMPQVHMYDRIGHHFFSCRIRNMKPYNPKPDLEGIQEAWIDTSGC